MELFGRELTIEQVIGFVRCNATPDEDLIHRAALELVADLEASQRRERAAVFDLSGHCEYCAFRNDCAKHDNNGSSAGFTWWTDCEDWQWRGPEQEGDANHEHDT